MPEESKLVDKLNEATKFTEDELKQVHSIRDGYIRVQNDYGQLAVARLRLQKQIEDMDKTDQQLQTDYHNLVETEQKFLEEVQKKYGEGTLNPDTGEFTKNK